MFAKTSVESMMRKNPHLRIYLKKYEQETGKSPEVYDQLTYDMRYLKDPDILYPVGDPIFIHIYPEKASIRYNPVVPLLTREEEEKKEKILDAIFSLVAEIEAQEGVDFKEVIGNLYNKAIYVTKDGKLPFSQRLKEVHQIPVTPLQYKNIKYYVLRDILEYGILQPCMQDPYIEDIHNIGTENIKLDHKIFKMVESTVEFPDEDELSFFLSSLGERMGAPVSAAHPITDAALPDGSRINIVFSKDISKRGPSFTIRKFPEEPFSVNQLIRFGTISPQIAAYIWMCLDHNVSIFICGETASGKTTTLNAIIPFIESRSKIYTAEETPELRAIQPNTQQLLTREATSASRSVTMFDLLKTALRSRPRYVLVGEIRGPEGAIAFQAMQTGHPVLSTFHCANIKQMVQRLTGDPINIPETFIDNLNVAIYQQMIYVRGLLERRVIAVEEILGYSRAEQGIVTRRVFSYDFINDLHRFEGLHNSFVLEQKISPRLGYDDPRFVYRDLDRRTRIVEGMLNQNILNYRRVYEVVQAYNAGGEKALPYTI